MAQASRARSAAIIHLSIFGRGFLRSPVSRLVLSFLSPSPSRSLLCTRTRYYRGTTTVNHNLARIPLPRSSLPPAGFHGPPPPPPPTRALSPRALSRDLAHDSRARATLAFSLSLSSSFSFFPRHRSPLILLSRLIRPRDAPETRYHGSFVSVSTKSIAVTNSVRRVQRDCFARSALGALLIAENPLLVDV